MPGALLAAGTTSLQRAAPIAGSAYTVTFYMRISANPGDQREIWVARNTGGSQFEGLEIRPTGVIRFLYVDGSGWSQLNTFVGMSLDTWWAFALTRDGDDLYCYAREDGGSTQSWTVNTSQASRGAWADLNWQLPSVSHDEDTGFQLTRLFDATMDQTAIEAEWDSITPVNTTDLVADWRFLNDTTDATRRNDSGAGNYDLSGTGDADWGASDLPLVFGSGGPTYADGTAYSTDGESSTVAPSAHVAASARSSDDGTSTSSPAAHVAVGATSLDHQADTGAPALHVSGTAYSLDHHAVYAGPAAHVAALATSADGEAARVALTLFASALASSTDGALASAGGALHASVTATSADADLVSAALSAAVSALASSTDSSAAQSSAALLVSALATSMDAHTAGAVGSLLVHGVATSVDDALAIVDLTYETPAPGALSYQTRSRAADTTARSSSVHTAARSLAA